MEMITEAVAQLRLEFVDEAWVRVIADSEYLEVPEIPPVYESLLSDVNVSLVLRNIIESVTLWLQDDNLEDPIKTWSYLKNKIKPRKMLALLCYFITRGTKEVLLKEYRDTAILAARLYFNFMFVSGQIAHDIYHSQILVHSLACLTYPRLLLEFYISATIIQEVNVLLLDINEYVTELHRVLVVLKLQPGDLHYDEILDCFLELTGGSVGYRSGVDRVQCATITAAVFGMIDVMIKGSEGRPCPAAINRLFSTMLRKLLTMCTGQSTNNLAQHNFNTFLGLLITRYKEYTIQALYILLQHLCYKQDLLDRHEVRLSRASLVLSLMCLLPKRSYCKFVHWLIQMTSYSYVMHRHMALEVLGRALERNNYESLQDDETEEPGVSADANASDMVVDTVRRNSSSGVENQEAEEQPNTNRLPTNNQLTLQQLYAEVLATFEQCTEDTICGMRVHALSIFTKCITSRSAEMRIAIEEFDKSGAGSRLMSIATSMVSDERATAKRAALDLLLELIKMEDTDEGSLKMLVTLCRDTSIQVRSATISALTIRCKTNPNPAVMNAFVSGPLHQLSDAEVKIQDQLVLAVKQIIIDNVKPYQRAETNSQAWMLTEAITNSSKRRYLDMAFTMMSLKFKCFNDKLVDHLKTHIGKYVPTHRSLHALVLLSCVGKHIACNNVMFLIQHFYNVGNSERHDVREIELTLELLSAWHQRIEESQRNKLRCYIINGVENGTLGDHGSGPHCLTFAGLLDKDNLQWASENMNTMVQSADENTPALQLEKLADLSLLSTTNPPYRIIRQMVRKLTHPDLDSKSCGIVVISIARLCIRSYPLCRRVASVFGEILLNRDGPLAPRVNALSALEDICSRHSGIVEPFMKTICTCLKREAPVLLRRKAARCITTLLLNQFLKLRTPLYYYYCALAMDSDTEVRDLSLNYVMCHLDPTVILNHFVDGVLYYNNSGPHAFDDYIIHIDETTRHQLYDLMLSRLRDPQKNLMISRLGSQVLSYAADMLDEQTMNTARLSEHMESAVHDTITLVTQLLFKVKRGKASAAELLIEEEDLVEQTAEQSAVSPRVRRDIADSLISGVVNLHSRIITAQSSLVVPLTRLGKDLMRYFKNDVDEFILKDDMLSDQINQFRKYVEKATNKAKVRVHRRPRKDSEPTAGPSSQFREPPSRSPGRSESIDLTSVPPRKSTSFESRKPPSRLSGNSESIEPTPGTSSQFPEPPSRLPRISESIEATPGLPRKRASSEFRKPPSRLSGNSESINLTSVPPRKRTSFEFRKPPSRLSGNSESIEPTPGTSSQFPEPPSRSPGRSNYIDLTSVPPRKRTNFEFRKPPSRLSGSSKSIEPTPGTSSQLHEPPSRSPGRSESIDPTPVPSRKRTSSEFSRLSGSSESIEPTLGPHRKRISSEFRKPSSRLSGSSESFEPTPGTSSQFPDPPPGWPGSSESIEPNLSPSRKKPVLSSGSLHPEKRSVLRSVTVRLDRSEVVNRLTLPLDHPENGPVPSSVSLDLDHMEVVNPLNLPLGHSENMLNGGDNF